MPLLRIAIWTFVIIIYIDSDMNRLTTYGRNVYEWPAIFRLLSYILKRMYIILNVMVYFEILYIWNKKNSHMLVLQKPHLVYFY